MGYLHGDGQGRPDFVPVDYTVDTILAVTATTLSRPDTPDTAGATRIYQCGVIDNDPSWTVSQCVEFCEPRFQSEKLPYLRDNAGISFIESRSLFLFIELVLYEVPLFALGLVAHLLSLLVPYFWLKLYYQAAGLRFQPPADKMESPLTAEEEARSLEVRLNDRPFELAKRIRFLQRARGKMKWFNANYTYFVNQRWRFDHSNVRALFGSLDAESAAKYNFDVDAIEFDEYAFEAALVCFRKYIAYRDDKKLAQRQREEALRHKLQCLRQRQRALRGQRAATAIDVVRKLFFAVGLDTKLTVGIGGHVHAGHLHLPGLPSARSLTACLSVYM